MNFGAMHTMLIHSKIKNSSGAGDTAVAAFLSAILDGEDPESALKYAAMAGRNNLYCKNIYDDLSDWEEMTEEIKSRQRMKLIFMNILKTNTMMKLMNNDNNE